VNVARYHLVDRVTYLALPWGIMMFSFLVNVAIAATVPPPPGGQHTGGLATIYIFLLVCGAYSMTRSLPFGLMLGVSRRTYYLGTALLVAALGVLRPRADGAAGRGGATGGWGLSLHFFRVPWIMDGPWYQTWLTSFVLLVLFFLYGMWYGLVFRRWSMPGLVAFIAAQVLVILVAVVAVSMTYNWSAVWHFFVMLTAPALTGVLAALAAVLGLGGFASIRRITV
jgi:hypothetical protein